MKKPNLKHFVLISYALKDLNQKEKVKFLRELVGYREKKKGKLYEHAGILANVKEQKLGSNVILISIDELESIQNFFSRSNVKVQIKEVWCR